MKKFLLAITMVASALAVNAEQPLKLGNFTDNWYVGVGGGAATSLRLKQVFPLNGTVTVFLGKQITPVVGLEIEGTAWLGSSAYDPNSKSRYHFNTGANGSYKTIVRGHYVGVNGTFNFSNLFAGYKGAPRPFEVGAVIGLGWNRVYNPEKNGWNSLGFKTGLDFNINLGESKAHSIRIQPAVDWNVSAEGANFKPRSRFAQLQLTAAYVYHFGNSQGKHYIVACDKKYSQDELDGRLNELRAQANADLAAKDKTISQLQSDLAAERAKEKTVIVNETKVTETQLAPVVIFRQGKSVIDASQKPSVAMIATYMKNHPTCKVRVNGYASPEGKAELNQKLSDARAKAVRDMLVNTYKISSDRISYKGLGVTDELFDENDWNRVATFIEESK